MNLDDCPPVLKVSEAAEVARVDSKTIRAACHRQELMARVDGRVIRISRDSLRVWINGEHQQRLRRLA